MSFIEKHSLALKIVFSNFRYLGLFAIIFVGIGIVTGIISNVLFYFIGKKLGGNTNWKKVFSVFFHTYVPAILMMIILSVLVFLMWSSLAEIDPSYFMSPDADEEQVLSAIGPMLVYATLIAVFAIANTFGVLNVEFEGTTVFTLDR